MQFMFKASTLNGSMIHGRLEARSVQEARGKLHDQGLLIIHLKECKGKTLWFDRAILALVGKRSKLLFQQRLVSQLSSLSRAGLPLTTCLQISIEETKQPFYKRALMGLKQGIEEGKSLAQAISEQNHLFPPLLVKMTAAAEEVGKLADVYDQLADTYQGELELRRKVSAAAIYPLFVLILALTGTVVISKFALPQIKDLLLYLEADPPLTTMILLSLGQHQTWFVFCLVMSIATVLFLLLWLTPGGARIRYFLLLRIPLLGPLVLRFRLAQTCIILGLCLGCGTPLLTALSIAGETATIEPIVTAIEQLKSGSELGLSLTSQLRTIKGVPSLLLQMVRVGEATGNMPNMLYQTGTTLSNDVRHSLTVAVTWVEPFLIIVAGAVVAITVSGIMLPLLAVIDVLG